MIGYIVKYQNNYTSSFMFQKTFIRLMEKGIAVHKLLDSEIFRYKIDFDEWPYIFNELDEKLKADEAAFNYDMVPMKRMPPWEF